MAQERLKAEKEWPHRVSLLFSVKIAVYLFSSAHKIDDPSVCVEFLSDFRFPITDFLVPGTEVRQSDSSGGQYGFHRPNDALHGRRGLRSGPGPASRDRPGQNRFHPRHRPRVHILFHDRRNEGGTHHGRLSGSDKILLTPAKRSMHQSSVIVGIGSISLVAVDVRGAPCRAHQGLHRIRRLRQSVGQGLRRRPDPVFQLQSQSHHPLHVLDPTLWRIDQLHPSIRHQSNSGK